MGDDATEARGDDATEARGKAPRPRRPRRAAADTGGPGKRSLNLRVDEDVYERLSVHALKSRTTISDLVGSLTREHCRDYAIHRVGVRGGGSGED